VAGLPAADGAFVPREKITLYLLNAEHPTGGPKARFFKIIGFSEAIPEALEHALLVHASLDSVTVQKKAWTTLRRIEGPMFAPNGKTYNLVSVWKLDEVRGIQSLVTACSGRR
jgi:hypothetical protein